MYHYPVNHDLGICFRLRERHFCIPSNDSFFIPIPKNGSTPISVESRADEIRIEPKNLKYKNLLIVLRDPIDRWVAGIAQFWVSEFNQQRRQEFEQFWDDAYNNIALDPHTYTQSSFLEDYDLSNASWFWLDRNTLDNAIVSWAKERNIFYKPEFDSDDNGFDAKHAALHNPDKVYIIEKLQSKLETTDIKQRLQEYYTKDYKLIHTVNFLNK